MLAQNFKSAAELGLTEIGRDAYIKVLGLLERGELVWTNHHLTSHIRNGFNMAIGWDESCGTVGCIAGWAGHFAREKTGRKKVSLICACRTEAQHVAFGNLICPIGFGEGKYTVEQAAHALRTYLVTGTAEWV